MTDTNKQTNKQVMYLISKIAYKLKLYQSDLIWQIIPNFLENKEKFRTCLQPDENFHQACRKGI